MDRVPGTVTIAPEVLVTIAQSTTQEVRGVHAMSTDWARDVNRFLGNTHVGDGMQVQVSANEDGLTINDRPVGAPAGDYVSPRAQSGDDPAQASILH